MNFNEFLILGSDTEICPRYYGHEDCEPSHSYGPIVRNTWLLHYINSGKGIFIREGIQYNVKPGDIFVIPPDIETYYEADKYDPWDYTWVGFSIKNELPTEFEPVIHCKKAGSIFEEILQCKNMKKGKDAFACGVIWKIIAVITEDRKGLTNDTDYVEKALHIMKLNYAQNININIIAEELNINRSYLSTLFKEKVGISPYKYLTNLRLNHAVKLMIENSTPPAIAATSAGYSDIYQFSKMFKKRFGVSPRNYAKEHNKDS